MPSEFLGRGWSWPVELDKGMIPLSSYEDCVSRSILVILTTARGERAMRPDFGCGINDLVFAVNNATTAGLVAAEVRQSLLRWEPRIEVLDIAVGPGDGPNELRVVLTYRVRATNNTFNIVYPFYLDGGVA